MKAAGTTDGMTVAAKMRATPVNDFFSKNVRVREDGRVLRDMHLFLVKKPEDSKAPWDLVTLVKTVKGEDAFQPLAESECALVASSK